MSTRRTRPAPTRAAVRSTLVRLAAGLALGALALAVAVPFAVYLAAPTIPPLSHHEPRTNP